MEYLSIDINPPPLDTKIIVKKLVFNFDDGAEIINMNSNIWSEESAVESLIETGFHYGAWYE